MSKLINDQYSDYSFWLSPVCVAVRLNTHQPMLRDDVWWQAFDMFMGAL